MKQNVNNAVSKLLTRAELFWLQTKIGFATHPWETNRHDIDRALKLERILNGRDNLSPKDQSEEKETH